MTPGQTSQSRGMPPVPIGIYCSPVTVQRGGLWLILWQLSLSDRSLGPLLYVDLGTKALLLSILSFARFQDINLICNNIIYIL